MPPITPTVPGSQEAQRAANLEGYQLHRFEFAAVTAADTWASGLLNIQEYAVKSNIVNGISATLDSSTGIFTFRTGAGGAATVFIWMPEAATA